MPTTTPLTDAINALTTYANETTGASDATLSDAVATLVEGYGQGGGEVEEAEIKIVNFLDYDARVAYSYTAQEFNELTELPPNVSHSGLIGQGWVWATVNAIKSMLVEAPKRKIFVYPYYITDDGKTRAYLEFILEQTVIFGFGINGTISIDWGDGTTDTLTGTSLTTKVTINHTYSVGKFVMSISVVSGTFAFGGTNNNSWFMNTNGTSANYNYAVRSALKKVEFGNGVSAFQNSSFYGYLNLKTITRPTGFDCNNANCFRECLSLVTFPREYASNSAIYNTGVRYYYGYANTSSGLNSARNLRYALIREDATSIGGSFFYGCHSLQEVWIPSNVTSISTTVFQNCYGLKEVHLLPTTPPTLADTNAFTNVPSACVIYVPYSADHSVLTAYQSANNWSSLSYSIVEEPQG